jgi:hypothetical protein
MKANIGKSVMTPANEETRDWLAKQHVGDEVEFEPLNWRSTKFNSYIFAVIGKLAAARGVSTNDMQAQLLVETGRFRMIKLSNTKRAMVLPSMRKGAWTMKQLTEFWDDARKIILDHLLIGLRDADADEIRNMLNDQTAGDDDGRTDTARG